MTYSVYQHWDPLKVCVVGRSYPPEFYSWIQVPHVRDLFERIAIETEEDYQGIIKKLKEFNVSVLRPDLPLTPFNGEHFVKPPMCPRDYFVMIGETFYDNYAHYDFGHFYYNNKEEEWPACYSESDILNLPEPAKSICITKHIEYKKSRLAGECFIPIREHIKQQGNTVKYYFDQYCHGAMVSRVGRDLYFGTDAYDQNVNILSKKINDEFVKTRNHIINTGGHADGTFCPVCPGLIVSLYDVPTYKDTFPGWEVVYLKGQSWDKVTEFLKLKSKNNGRWWIPGFEHDTDVVNTVEQWLGHWTGYVEETVFDVNMLIIDPKNVMVFNYNNQVFDALNRYGITPHIVPFRHRYFWDGGIHCVTLDLHREGIMQDYFPERL